MAAPTNVRVEAISIAATALYWSYSGSALIAVYRSTDGSSYSEATTAGTRVAVGTTTYRDEGLVSGTKYWYKLTDDGGSTFSAVVTAWTQGCPTPGSADQEMGLPDDSTAALARRVEELFQDKVFDPQKCLVCDSDGKLVFDCSGGCIEFQAIITADVNSITFQNCPADTPVDLIIPPSTTRKICGWPAGFGFSGDECHNAPFIAGPNGITYTVGGTRNGSSRPSIGLQTGSGTGGVGGGSGGGCTCTPGPDNALTIRSCNNKNSLNCASTKSLRLLVCGGTGPYSWTKSGGIQLKGPQAGATAGSTASGTSITVTPPANTSTGAFGHNSAYWSDCYSCGTCVSGVCTAVNWDRQGDFDCDDVWVSALAGDPSPCDRITQCPTPPAAGSLSACCNNNTDTCAVGGCTDTRATCRGVSLTCDKRTAPMLAGGCNPCGLQGGTTVTVTDATGKSVTIVLVP